jgi:hypothetical protein
VESGHFGIGRCRPSKFCIIFLQLKGIFPISLLYISWFLSILCSLDHLSIHVLFFIRWLDTCCCWVVDFVPDLLDGLMVCRHFIVILRFRRSDCSVFASSQNLVLVLVHSHIPFFCNLVLRPYAGSLDCACGMWVSGFEFGYAFRVLIWIYLVSPKIVCHFRLRVQVLCHFYWRFSNERMLKVVFHILKFLQWDSNSILAFYSHHAQWWAKELFSSPFNSFMASHGMITN